MVVLQDCLNQMGYVEFQVLSINCYPWSFQSCSKRSFRKSDYDLHPGCARPLSADILADFSEAVLQGPAGHEPRDRNLAPGIYAGHSYITWGVFTQWDQELCSWAWVYSLGLVWCFDSGEKHGELLMKIRKLHLGVQIVASCLSSFLTCIGP